MITPEDLVNKWLRYKDLTPLKFRGGILSKDEPSSNLTLDDLIFKCLVLTSSYHSYNADTLDFETHLGRWRSSLDIWRHVKYYKPDVIIFDVMRSLFKQKEFLEGHYCCDIYRRVFKANPSGGDYYCYEPNDPDDLDEFSLNFNEWEYIGLTKKDE